MKRKLNNPGLWQKKRGELPVNGDPAMDWLQMQTALDKVMPVSAPVNRPFKLKPAKWWLKGLMAGTSAIVIYAAVQLYIANKQHPAPVHQQQNIRKNIVAEHPKDSSSTAGHDSTTAATKGTLHAKPLPIHGSTVIPHPVRSSQDTEHRYRQKPGDTVSMPHRDSLLSPANFNPLKAVHDSVKLPAIGNKPIRKDTTGTDKKGQKKHKRPKVNIFT